MAPAPKHPLRSLAKAALSSSVWGVVVFSVLGLALLDVFWVGSVFLLVRVPLALGCGLFLSLFWRRLAWMQRACLATAVVLCATSYVVDVSRRPSAATHDIDASTQLRVVSFNVLFVNQNHKAIAKMIKNSGADVVLLQEVTPAHERALAPKLKRLFPHQRWNPLHGAFGTAILAKEPLSAGTTMHLADGNRFAQCATVGQVPHAVLCSIHLSSPAEAFPPSASRRFVGRLNRVALRRADQSDVLLQRIERWEEKGLPVIAGGDFNTLEFEPVHRQMQQALVDTFRSENVAVGGTWPHGVGGGPFKFLGATARIDYIFASQTFDVVDAQVLGNAKSDHAAVMATLRYQQRRQQRRQ